MATNGSADANIAMETRLWAFIDGVLPPEERSEVERLIQEHAAWKVKYGELLDAHQALLSLELEEPSMRFTQNVMDEITRLQITPATKVYINKKIIYGIAGFFITIIIAFLIYGISQVDWSAGKSSEGALGLDMSKVDYSRVLDNTYVNIFLMANAVLGLMLLDRYLNFRRKSWSH